MAQPNSDISGNTVALYLSFATMAKAPRSARVLSAHDTVVGLSSTKTTLGTFELNHVSVKRRTSAYREKNSWHEVIRFQRSSNQKNLQ